VRLPKITYENPVATRELRMRMRGGRAYLVLFAYVLVLSLVVFVGYLVSYATVSSGYGGINQELGKHLFIALFGFQAALIGLVVPGLTAWLLSVEHEQQTFELLVSTLLTPANIIAGKLLPSVMYLGLLLLSSLPLSTFCLVFGGLSPLNVLSGYVGLFVYGFVLAATGILCSSLFKKSFAATIAAYVLAGAYSVVPAALLSSVGMTGVSLDNWAGMSLVPGYIGGMLAMDEWSVYFMGFRAPTVLLSAISGILLGLLLATVATANIPHQSEDRAPVVRVMLLVYSIVVMLILVGGTFGPSPAPIQKATEGQLAVCYACLAIIAVTMAPQFTATTLKESVDRWQTVLRSLSPGNWVKTDALGGFGFALVWTLVMAAILNGGIVLAAAEGMWFSQETTSLLVLTLSMVLCSGSLGFFLYAATGAVPLARALSLLLVALYWAVTSALWSAVGVSFGFGGATPATPRWVEYVWFATPFRKWSATDLDVGEAWFFTSVYVAGYVVLSMLLLFGARAALFRRRMKEARAAAMPTTRAQPSQSETPPPAILVE